MNLLHSNKVITGGSQNLTNINAKLNTMTRFPCFNKEYIVKCMHKRPFQTALIAFYFKGGGSFLVIESYKISLGPYMAPIREIWLFLKAVGFK